MLRILRNRIAKRQCSVPHPQVRHRLQLAAFSTLYGPASIVFDQFTAWLFNGDWSRWQDAAVTFLPDEGHIVELGSGTGALASRYSLPNRPWTCIESSGQMIRVATRRRTPSYSLARADATALPLPNRCAAAVIATFPTSFILEQACQREVARILEPDGELVVLLSARLTGRSWPIRWRRLALSGFYGKSAEANLVSDISDLFPGFRSRIESVSTASGTALILVATPSPAGDMVPNPT